VGGIGFKAHQRPKGVNHWSLITDYSKSPKG